MHSRVIAQFITTTIRILVFSSHKLFLYFALVYLLVSPEPMDGFDNSTVSDDKILFCRAMRSDIIFFEYYREIMSI